MKERKKKQKDLETLRGALQENSSVFVTGFSKLTVAQDFQLRKAVRGAGGMYHVVKNTIASKASAGLPAEQVLAELKGVSAVAYTAGDPVALAKALSAYAKANPAFTFKAGLVEGRAINLAEIQELALMPPKEEIYAKLLWVINAPAQQLVTAINGVGRNLAIVVDQGVKENKFASE
ncbi:MAG: 50S ribosomal protein L10 [Bryobacterales bacterium]|jgi:large subunit ribosomal protein L10|nr:50S ribosomal protein L10 [Bryobacterales bacterium]